MTHGHTRQAEVAVSTYARHGSEQFQMSEARHREPSLGERRLAAATLRLALTDVRNGNRRRSFEASRWIRLGDRGSLSFDFCCEVLGFDRVWMRERLLQ